MIEFNKHILKIVCAIFLLLGLSIGLAVTIKYGFIDETNHYHKNSCHVNSCLISETQCCESSKMKRNTDYIDYIDDINMINGCDTCYNVIISYSLTINDKIYTKTDRKNIFDPRYCEKIINDILISCFYDDRDIQNSLRLWAAYLAEIGFFSICVLSMSLCFVLFFTIITIKDYRNSLIPQTHKSIIMKLDYPNSNELE